MVSTNFALPSFARASVGHSTPMKTQGTSGDVPSLKQALTTDVVSLTFAGDETSALEKACDKGNVDRLKTLAVYSTQEEKDQALLRVVSQETPNKAVIQVLLKAKANPSADNGTGRTPLTEATTRNHPDDIMSLLKVDGTGAVAKVYSATEKETIQIKASRLSPQKLVTALKNTVGEDKYQVSMRHDTYLITIPQGSKDDLLDELGMKQK